MVHGCMQDSDSFARLTGMSSLASQKGFAVLYPNQETVANPMQCWNWYAPENQRRVGGEPESLAQLIQQAQKIIAANPERTHIAGISAGGAQTALMIHLYPELFSSAVIVAGPLPFVAKTLPEALTEMAEGPSLAETRAAESNADQENVALPIQGKRIPVLIIHGEQDDLVAFRNAESQAVAVIDLEDMLDNKQFDGSVHARKVAKHGP